MGLYKDLAHVYQHMYQALFDYDAEYTQLKKWLDLHMCKSLLECGCGSGNLASRFIGNEYDYTGFDISQDMVNQAQLAVRNGHFTVDNVVTMMPEDQYDAVIMVGRTISYLTTNPDVESALANMLKACKPNGIIIIDPIDASQMSKESDTKDIELVVTPYKRYSRSELLSLEPYIWNWKGKYVEIVDDEEYVKGYDEAILRAFYHEELTEFFDRVGLKILDKFPKKSYAWDDHYYVLQKL